MAGRLMCQTTHVTGKIGKGGGGAGAQKKASVCLKRSFMGM